MMFDWLLLEDASVMRFGEMMWNDGPVSQAVEQKIRELRC